MSPALLPEGFRQVELFQRFKNILEDIFSPEWFLQVGRAPSAVYERWTFCQQMIAQNGNFTFGPDQAEIIRLSKFTFDVCVFALLTEGDVERLQLGTLDRIGDEAVRAAFVKATPVSGKTQEDLDTAIHQLVSKAIAAEGVVDLFAAMGLKTPDISILSDEFLAEVRDLPHRNLALELLEKLLNDEIKARSRRNVVESRSFRERLEQALIAYQNRSIETAQIIAQLIDLAREMQAARRRGEELGLSEEELAFYDALETNDSAVQVLGDEQLRTIARELVRTVRANVTIDWTVRENVRANLRVLVKRLLRRYGYPPDKQEKATATVLEQAELWEKRVDGVRIREIAA
jgi:hypothetical protein